MEEVFLRASLEGSSEGNNQVGEISESENTADKENEEKLRG